MPNARPLNVITFMLIGAWGVKRFLKYINAKVATTEVGIEVNIIKVDLLFLRK